MISPKNYSLTSMSAILAMTALTACNIADFGGKKLAQNNGGRTSIDGTGFADDEEAATRNLAGPNYTGQPAIGGGDRRSFEKCITSLKNTLVADNSLYSPSRKANQFAAVVLEGMKNSLLKNPADIPVSAYTFVWVRTNGGGLASGDDFPCNGEYWADNNGAYSPGNDGSFDYYKNKVFMQREANIDAGMMNVMVAAPSDRRGYGGSVFGGAFICKGARAYLPSQYQISVPCKELGEIGLTEGRRSGGDCGLYAPAQGGTIPCCSPGYRPSKRKLWIYDAYGITYREPISNVGRDPAWYPVCIKADGSDSRIRNNCPVGQRPSNTQEGACSPDNYKDANYVDAKARTPGQVITYNSALCWTIRPETCMGERTRCRLAKSVPIYLAFKASSDKDQNAVHEKVAQRFGITREQADAAWDFVEDKRQTNSSLRNYTYDYLKNPVSFDDRVCSEFNFGF